MVAMKGGDAFIKEQNKLIEEKKQKLIDAGKKPSPYIPYQGVKTCNDNALTIQRGVSVFQY